MNQHASFSLITTLTLIMLVFTHPPEDEKEKLNVIKKNTRLLIATNKQTNSPLRYTQRLPTTPQITARN